MTLAGLLAPQSRDSLEATLMAVLQTAPIEGTPTKALNWTEA